MAVFLHLFLQFYYISVAVTLFRVRGMVYVVRIILRCSRSPASHYGTMFGSEVVTITYYAVQTVITACTTVQTVNTACTVVQAVV